MARGLMMVLMGNIEIGNRFTLTVTMSTIRAPDRQPVFSVIGPSLTPGNGPDAGPRLLRQAMDKHGIICNMNLNTT